MEHVNTKTGRKLWPQGLERAREAQLCKLLSVTGLRAPFLPALGTVCLLQLPFSTVSPHPTPPSNSSFRSCKHSRYEDVGDPETVSTSKKVTEPERS